MARVSKAVQSLIEVEIVVILTRFADKVRHAKNQEVVIASKDTALRQIKELYDG